MQQFQIDIKKKYGIFHLDVDGVILLWDEDAEYMVNEFKYEPGFKPWRRSARSKCPPERFPKRLVQFKDCAWTGLYLCDGWGTEAAQDYLNDEFIKGISMYGSTKMLCLELGGTSGIYRLREYWIGKLLWCMATDCRSFGPGELRDQCERVTVHEIDAKLKEYKVFYSQIEDGGRTKDGAILPFEEAEPYAAYVRKHYLLF